MCPEHALPLNFWSDKETIYKCIKCLINEKEVHFVDHSYKSKLEYFKELQSMTESMLKNNKWMPHTIEDWKSDIRDMVLRVRQQMIDFIDNFSDRFIR